MKVGLVGFAGSGKTTVFNTMTGLAVPTGFGGEVRLGTVKVPDERIDALSRIFKPKKTVYAEIVFCDVPGEHGAGHRGLSRKALQQIRDQDVLCLVLRAFDNPAVEGAPDPAGDLEAVRLAIGISVIDAFTTATIFVVAVVLMVAIDLRLTLLALAPLPFVSIAVKRFGAAIHTA